MESRNRDQKHRHFLQWLGTIVVFMFLLAGCTVAQADALPYVDLSQRSPLPSAAASHLIPLRLAVAAIISPQGTAESYGKLANYLGKKLHRSVQLAQRRTYAEVNDLVAEEQVDLAFVCTSAYIDGHDSFGMELLAAPEIGGSLVYRSTLIVAANSPAQTMADLRGSTFAFTDPMSFTGRVYPTHLVQELGETPESFFAKTFFTYSHDRAIEAVAAGVAGAAMIDSLVLDYALERQPALSTKLRVIHRSPPFGMPPVVTSPTLSVRQKQLLRDALLAMDQDAEGQTILRALGIDRFLPVKDALYADVRRMIEETEARR